MRHCQWITAGILVAAAAHGLVATAFAASPADVADLVGVKGRDGESELERRGYDFHHGTEAADGKRTTWWNAAAKSCLEVLTADGRYAAIDAVPAGHCDGPAR
jgi:hypothetical protein